MKSLLALFIFASIFIFCEAQSQEVDMEVEANVFPGELSKKQILENYFDRMSAPKPMKFTEASEWLNRKAVLK